MVTQIIHEAMAPYPNAIWARVCHQRTAPARFIRDEVTFWLRFERGLSINEIADLMERDRASVRLSLVRHGRRLGLIVRHPTDIETYGPTQLAQLAGRGRERIGSEDGTNREEG